MARWLWLFSIWIPTLFAPAPADARRVPPVLPALRSVPPCAEHQEPAQPAPEHVERQLVERVAQVAGRGIGGPGVLLHATPSTLPFKRIGRVRPSSRSVPRRMGGVPSSPRDPPSL